VIVQTSLRENLHGLFTVNLGVYIPEVARHHDGGEAKVWVQDYHCSIRAPLASIKDYEESLERALAEHGWAVAERRESDVWWRRGLGALLDLASAELSPLPAVPVDPCSLHFSVGQIDMMGARMVLAMALRGSSAEVNSDGNV
jgi:hypothetical protein